MRRIITRGVSLGIFPAGLGSIVKIVLAMVLITASSAANAVTVLLVSHQQTADSGTLSTLITDGSHVEGFAASTAVFEWDGTTLSSTGIYSATGSLGSSPATSAVLNDHIVDLSIDTTSTATATSYACNEGTFLAGVGANGCGDYTLGSNFLDESTTVWTGLSVSQTIGGDDVAGIVGPRTISVYDFNSVTFNGDGLHVGDEVLIGNGLPLGVAGLGGELMTFSLTRAAIDDAISTSPDQSVNIPVLANDILDDGAGENITALTATVPANGTAGVVGTVPTVRANLSIKYTPDPGFVGSDTFNYTVTDQGGMATATVTVAVTDQVGAVDDGTPAAPFGSVRVGQTVSLDVLANDTGLSAIPLTVVAPLNTMPVLGTVIVTGSPGDATAIRVSFTAGAVAGLDAFDYQVSDNNGTMDDASVLVEVLPLNIPIAVDDSEAIFADVDGVTFAGGAGYVRVLDNDDGLVDTPLTVTTTEPSNGSVGPIQLCDNQGSCKVWYTPDPGFFGIDSFQYTVTDSTNESATAKVTITVTEEPLVQMPVAVKDTASTLENQVITIAVLANDTGISNTPLQVVADAPTSGTAVVQTNNTIVYTPTVGGVSSDTFTYTVTDANENSSTARVNISITLLQDSVPGKSSALGPVGLGFLVMLIWLRGRRHFMQSN